MGLAEDAEGLVNDLWDWPMILGLVNDAEGLAGAVSRESIPWSGAVNKMRIGGGILSTVI